MFSQSKGLLKMKINSKMPRKKICYQMTSVILEFGRRYSFWQFEPYCPDLPIDTFLKYLSQSLVSYLNRHQPRQKIG